MQNGSGSRVGVLYRRGLGPVRGGLGPAAGGGVGSCPVWRTAHCECTDRHTRLKTLSSRNFVAGGKNEYVCACPTGSPSVTSLDLSGSAAPVSCNE